MAKILIIEDETMLRNEVIEWLILEGHEAVGAADGVEGLNYAFRNLPDLIISDVTMPRLDGHRALLELRANPSTAITPFIFITARAAYEDVRKGMDLGADDYLIKPFTRIELLGAIQTRLDKKTTFENKHQGEVVMLQQSLAQEHERLMLKAKLVAMFSHDFRNPLTTILSSNSLLRDYANRMDDSRRLTHHDRVDASVRQLLQMLDDMLTVAQMETGNLDFKPEYLNLQERLQKIVEEFQAIHAEAYSIIFKSTFNDMVMVDSRLLHQITANLISNAIKYSPHGSEIYVSLKAVDDTIVLTVQDHGIGIPDADQSHIFSAFQRASNVGEVRGTGLGLSIVQQAVELHNGTISLESQVGVGTTVTVKLPL